MMARLVLLCLLLFLLIGPSTAIPNLPTAEYNALHDIYNATNGENWNFQTGNKWSFNVNGANPCTDNWTGIKCGNCTKKICHVVELDLAQHNLKGYLPASVNSFSKLATLDVRNNYLWCTVPNTICQLPQLQVLNLANNKFVGSLPPEIGNCSKLTYAILNRNLLTNSLPPQLFNLQTLVKLDLSFNSLTGRIPQEVGNAKNMKQIILQLNFIGGTIPFTFAKLHNLVEFDISHNHIKGIIPDIFSTMSSLKNIEFAANELHGSLPSSIFSLANLSRLSVENNTLTGHLSPELGKLTNLTSLLFNGNNFNGTVTNEITKLVYLRVLSLERNKFTGPIPRDIGRLRDLISLSLQFNYFSGRLTDSLCNLTNIRNLQLGSNIFSGSIPNSTYWPYLRLLDLSYNRMTGSLTAEFFHHTKLRYFYINHNHFSGNLTAFSQQPKIKIFNLVISFNQFTGRLPHGQNVFGVNNATNNNWRNLFEYNIGTNYFTGSIDDSFQYSNDIGIFNVSNNFLSGTLPTWSFESFPVILQFFSAAVNMLSGSLPEGTPNSPTGAKYFTKFQFLYLEENYLSGTIPNSWQYFVSLIDLSLNHNMLRGNVPLFLFKQFTDLQILSFQNNEFSGTLPFTDISVQNNSSTLRRFNESIFGFSTSLLNIDLSNNYLTGTFPSVLFFLYPFLHSLSANNNCFDLKNLFGSLETSNIIGFSSNDSNPFICQATNISQISMDGLSSNPHCRKFIFPTLSHFVRTYFISVPITSNTLPACMLSLPQILSIHLSGNAIVGTIPNLNVYENNSTTSGPFLSPSLVDLALSYNRLSGTIPESIQMHRNWKYLDLSYNKLSGGILADNKWYNPITESFAYGTIIADDFADAIISNLEQTELYLEVNRLSDNIPSNLLNLEVVSILRGNLFGCAWDSGTDGLPKNDPNAENYNCGSSLANTVFLFWIIVFTLAFVVPGLLIIDCRKNGLCFLHHIYHKIRAKYMKLRFYDHFVFTFENIIFPQLTTKFSNQRISVFRPQSFASISSAATIDMSPLSFSRFLMLSSKIRKLFTQLTVVLIVVYMPVYSIISKYLKVYKNTYAWEVSAILLSGTLSGVVIMVMVMMFIVMLWFLMDFLHFRTESIKKELNVKKKVFISRKHSNYSWGQGVIFVFNCIVMIIVDVVYVFIYLGGNSVAIFFSQIALAVFKIIWNDSVLWRLMNYLHDKKNSTRNLSVPSDTVTANDDVNLPESVSLKDVQVPANQARVPNIHEIFFMIMCNFFNSIVLPCIAIMIVHPNCFYNAIVPAQSITTSYADCIHYDGFVHHYSCSAWQIINNNPYDPPFVYSYQCSSYVIINYIPVHIVQCVLVSILLPAGKYCVKYCYDYLNHIKLHAEAISNSSGLHPKAKYAQWSVFKEQCLSICKMLLPEHFLLFPFFHFTARPQLQCNDDTDTHKNGMEDDVMSNEDTESSKKLMISDPPKRLVFKKHKVLIRIHSLLALLVVFGFVFPPLAIIVCVTVWLLTLPEEILLGKVLFEITRHKFHINDISISSEQNIDIRDDLNNGDNTRRPFALTRQNAKSSVAVEENVFISDEASALNWYCYISTQLNDEYDHIMDSFKHTKWLLIWLVSISISYVVFDTIGDETGWENALLIVLCLLFFPLLLHCIQSMKNMNKYTKNCWNSIHQRMHQQQHLERVNSMKLQRISSLKSTKFIDVEMVTTAPVIEAEPSAQIVPTIVNDPTHNEREIMTEEEEVVEIHNPLSAKFTAIPK